MQFLADAKRATGQANTECKLPDCSLRHLTSMRWLHYFFQWLPSGSQPSTVLRFHLLHAYHQAGIHTAVLGALLIEPSATHAMLTTKLRHRRTGFSPLQDGNDLAVGKAREIHAKFPKCRC